MNNLSKYIIEKLHLNKDIKIDDVLKPTVDNFAVGDLCLYLTHVSPGKSSNPSFVTIDVVQVKRILSTSIICNYKTAFSFGEAYKATQLNFKYTYHQDDENSNRSNYSKCSKLYLPKAWHCLKHFCSPHWPFITVLLGKDHCYFHLTNKETGVQKVRKCVQGSLVCKWKK